MLRNLYTFSKKISLTIIYIPFENMLTKRWPGTYILHYFSLVEAIISHQKMRLTCRTTAQLLYGMYKYHGQELFSALTTVHVNR